MPAKAATVAIEIKADASDALRDVSKAEAALQDLEQAARQAGSGASGIDELTAAVADLQAATEDASQGAGGLSDAFAGGVAGGAIVAGISALGGAVKAAFSKLAELGSEAFSQAMDFDVGRDKLQAQLGLSAEQAKKMGQLAGDLYSQAYGDSIGEVNEALRSVTLNVGLNADTQAQQLQQVTASVLDLAHAFDQDLGETARAVGKLLKTGLAANAREAMDVLTRGFQLGNDEAGDLLEVINEYSTSFRDVGLDAKTFMGILRQGLAGGARDADKVADAIKEFGIRSKDASKQSAEGFEALGLNAQKMTALFARGGTEAAGGLDLVLDKLRAMEDPVKRNEVAVKLFGTQSEDLARALNSIDPSEAVAALGEVGGAADKMGKDLADNSATRFESWKRTVQTNIITFIADNLLPALDTVGGKAQEAFGQALEAWKAFQRGFTGVEPVNIAVEDGKLTSSISAIEGMDPTKGSPVLKQLQDLGEEVRKLADEWLPKLRQALEDTGKSLQDLSQWLKDNKDAMELLKIAGIVVLVAAFVALITVIGIVMASLATLGGVILLLLSPIILIIFWVGKLGDGWEGVMRRLSFSAGTAVDDIAEALSALGRTLSTFFDFVWPDDWARFWKTVEDIVRGAANAVTGFIAGIRREIENFLGLISRISNPFSLPSIGPRSLAPSAVGMMPAMLMAPSAAAAPAPTVINVSIQHTGLGVDSPRLQRDIVETLRRYEKRNGNRLS
jgi:phage-related minor tail protein